MYTHTHTYTTSTKQLIAKQLRRIQKLERELTETKRQMLCKLKEMKNKLEIVKVHMVDSKAVESFIKANEISKRDQTTKKVK